MDSVDVSAWTALRRSPVHAALFVAVPILLATAQIANALLNGFPLWAAATFAVVMVAYAAMALRLHCSRLRVRILERGAPA